MQQRLPQPGRRGRGGPDGQKPDTQKPDVQKSKHMKTAEKVADKIIEILDRCIVIMFICAIEFSFFTCIYRKISWLSDRADRTLLILLVAVLPFAGLIYCLIWNREHMMSVAYEVLIGIGVHTALAYWEDLRVFMSVVFSVTASVFLFKTYKVTSHKIRVTDFAARKRILKARALEVCNSARVIFGLGTALILTVTLFSLALGGKNEPQTVKQTYVAETTARENYTVENSLDRLSALVDGSWAKTPDSEKLEVLQAVANVVACKLGVAKIPLVHSAGMEAEHRDSLAYYRYGAKDIVVSKAFVSKATPEEAVSVICHEVYHAYSHCLVDLYESIDEEFKGLLVFKQAGEYLEEFSDYISPGESYEGYYRQRLEVDAREYEEAEAPRLIEEIKAALSVAGTHS